jgi:hypothetical protein
MVKYKDNNIFEKLGALIPGYKGYSEMESRRETDKILRNFIADSLSKNLSLLIKWKKSYLKQGRLEELNDLDDIEKRIRIISNNIKFAQQGHSGFFDLVQVNEETLNNLYLYDLKFKEKIENFTSNMNAIETNSQDVIVLKKLAEQLDSLKQIVENRDNIIMEIK